MGPEAAVIAQVAGTLMSVVGGMNQADNMRAAAAANARNAADAAAANKQQLDYQAGQEEAAGQHQAIAARRKAALMLSRAQAVSAAGGGGGLDESLMSGLIEAGEKEAGFASYGARERATGLRYRGNVGAYEANAKGIQGIKEANAAADATIMGSFAKGAFGLAALAPGAAPGTMTVGDTTYYGGAGPDRNWGYGD
jgi:hypothetical protein